MINSPRSKLLDTPVLLLIFNRPETTFEVFDAIREARPKALFISADGPRKDRVDDLVKCDAARSIVNKVDWDCDLKVHFQDQNLGCGRGPANGIAWFFQHVEEGIILEDDCLPAPGLFPFCSELLKRFRHDNRVMEIGATNFIDDICRNDEYSYYFSNHSRTWGWATWRRAWQLYDYTISAYQDEAIKSFLKRCFNSSLEYAHFKRIFDETFEKNDQISWWDYQWEFARRINLGLSIVSKTNLIRNIGLGSHATHTLNANGIGAGLKWGEMRFPLKHPVFISANKVRDDYYFRRTFTTLKSRIKANLITVYDMVVKPMSFKSDG